MRDLRTPIRRARIRPAGAGFPPELAAAFTDTVWAELQRVHGILSDRPSHVDGGEPAVWAGCRRGAFDALATPAVVAAISEVLGDERRPHPFSRGDPWSPAQPRH